jgi:hypothetical protein
MIKRRISKIRQMMFIAEKTPFCHHRLSVLNPHHIVLLDIVLHPQSSFSNRFIRIQMMQNCQFILQSNNYTITNFLHLLTMIIVPAIIIDSRGIWPM